MGSPLLDLDQGFHSAQALARDLRGWHKVSEERLRGHTRALAIYSVA